MTELAGSVLVFIGIAIPAIRHIPYIGWYAVHKYKEMFMEVTIFLLSSYFTFVYSGEFYSVCISFNCIQENRYIERCVARSLKDFDAVSDEAQCFTQAYVQRAKNNEALT